MKRVFKLRESELKHIISESVKGILKEYSRDIDDDNYYGGGLPDSFFNDFDDDAPESDRISQKQLKQLGEIVNTIADIANNISDDADLLFQATDLIDEFLSRYNSK